MPRKGQVKKDTLDKIKNHLNIKGLKLVEYRGVNYPIVAHCERHGAITLRPTSVKAGSGCKLCANERISEIYKKKAVVNLLKSLDVDTELDITSYSNSTTLAVFKCLQHNITYQQTPRDYKAGWRACPKCRRTSRPEQKIQEYLVKNNISFKREKTFDSCVNIETSRKLPFDFYLPEYNMLIEYDGEHHYSEFKHLAGDLKKRVELDTVKTQWAEKNNILLFRIPYWEYTNIESLLKDILQIETKRL